MQLLERAICTEPKMEDNWLKIDPVAVTERDLEPEDYKLDISKEVRLIIGIALYSCTCK